MTEKSASSAPLPHQPKGPYREPGSESMPGGTGTAGARWVPASISEQAVAYGASPSTASGCRQSKGSAAKWPGITAERLGKPLPTGSENLTMSWNGHLPANKIKSLLIHVKPGNCQPNVAGAHPPAFPRRKKTDCRRTRPWNVAPLQPDQILVLFVVGVDVNHHVSHIGELLENKPLDPGCDVVGTFDGHLGIHVEFEVDNEILA